MICLLIIKAQSLLIEAVAVHDYPTDIFCDTPFCDAIVLVMWYVDAMV